MIQDLNHYFGKDLSVSPSGDLAAVEGSERTRQRILRRLLTNPGDYIFHPDYGAGLPAKIGSVISVSAIQALVVGQVLLEDAVARFPEPVVSLLPFPGGAAISIAYTDATTGAPDGLSFNLTQ